MRGGEFIHLVKFNVLITLYYCITFEKKKRKKVIFVILRHLRSKVELYLVVWKESIIHFTFYSLHANVCTRLKMFILQMTKKKLLG